MTTSGNYLYAYFVVQGKEKAYPFLLLSPKDMPGVYIFADSFEGYTPNITYLQKTDSVAKDVDDLMKHEIIEHLGSLFGVYPALYEIDRNDVFADILERLGRLPKCNQLVSLN